MTNEPQIPLSTFIKYLRDYQYNIERRRQEAIKSKDRELPLILEGGSICLEALIDSTQEYFASNGSDTNDK